MNDYLDDKYPPVRGTVMPKFEIPWDAADQITLASLENHYNILKEGLDDWYNNRQWMHREDVEENSVMMHHLKAVISYYGGSVE